ncbi:sugar O-acetyltransferase, partial [Escherichia coli]|nr:sugar O-acetyltransferase [Escherichia coli]
RRFNLLDPGDVQGQTALLAEIFGKVGKNCVVCAPLYVDYGKNTEIGEGFFANYNFVVLDVAKVTIGNDVFCGPNVTLTT